MKRNISLLSEFRTNRQVMKNITWLTVLQFANYLIPILIIPYIVRVIGVNLFGKVSYAQNIISYFTLFVNFGFDYFATREISVNRENKEKTNCIFWSVIKLKIILFFISFCLFIALGISFDKIKYDFVLYLIVFSLNIGVVLFPTWFFQGIEDMGTMAVFNFLIKAIGLILTFLFVKKANDYLLYPLFLSLSYVVAGVISFIYVLKKYHFHFQFTSKSFDLDLLKKSSPIFLNNLFVSFYTLANLTILGFYKSDFEVGIYSGAYKIISAILMVTSMPLNTAVFPMISREFSHSIANGIRLLKRMIRYSSFLLIILFILLLLSSKIIIQVLLGNNFVESIPVFKIFSLLPLLVTVASLLTVQGLYGLQLQKYAPYVGFTIGIISISLNLFFIPKYGIVSTAWIWVASELIEILFVSFLLKKHLKKIYEN
jgi:PST family polysaccharide transporter